MGWLPERPLQRCFGYFTAGFADRITYRITGKKSCFGKAFARKLSECEPWSDHIDAECMNGIRKALEVGDYPAARFLCAMGSEDGASKYCLQLASDAIEFIAKSSEFDVELLSFLE